MKLAALACLAAFARIISISAAAPVADACTDIDPARPFKIIVSSPHRQTLLPEYTLCNGRITSIKAHAATYSIAHGALGLLFCEDSKSSTISQLTGNVGFTESGRNFAVVPSGKHGIYQTFFLKDGKVGFNNAKKLGWAKWVLRGGEGGETVQANFGGISTQDFISADLTPEFIEAKPSLSRRSNGELHARRALPFKISVSSPNRQTLVPEYTLCNGKITSIKADAARYYFSDTSPFGLLYCSDAESSTTSRLSGQIGFSKSVRNFAVYSGKKGIFATFSLDDKRLQFHDLKKLGSARWVLNESRKEGVMVEASFGGLSTYDFIPAHLTAVFEDFEEAPPIEKRSEGELHARRALPFKLNVSFPNRQTLVAETPTYTLCNGKITSTKADAARYYFSDTSPLGLLYCSDVESSTTSQVSGQMGFSKKDRNFAVYSGKKGIYSRFFLDDGKMQFNDERRFGFGAARWVLGEGGRVQACFGGLSKQDFSPVKLTAEFEL